MAIKKVGALVTVTMSAEDEINPVRFEQRDEVRAQRDLRRVKIRVV